MSESEEELLSHVSVFPGMDVNEAYDLKHLLGDGAFSKVFLAESRKDSGGFAAVKIIDKQELCKDEDKMFLVDKEIEIMSQLDHPNIVRLYGVGDYKFFKFLMFFSSSISFLDAKHLLDRLPQ